MAVNPVLSLRIRKAFGDEPGARIRVAPATERAPA